jgi:hypothetical protein
MLAYMQKILGAGAKMFLVPCTAYQWENYLQRVGKRKTNMVSSRVLTWCAVAYHSQMDGVSGECNLRHAL